MVGLYELQVGLLGCSHRGGGRVVQAVGFSPRTETRRVASTGGALSLWSHRPLRKTAKATVLPGVMVWFFKKKKEKERETERKSGPLPLSKQKSSVRSRLGGALPSAHFKSTPRKVRSSVFHIDGAKRRRFRAGVGLAVTEVGEQP